MKEMSTIPKMRTVSEILKMIKMDDPQTALTLTGLRRIIKQGKIHIEKIGRKTLVNCDALIDYLNRPQPTEAKATGYGVIRQVC